MNSGGGVFSEFEAYQGFPILMIMISKLQDVPHIRAVLAILIGLKKITKLRLESLAANDVS